MSSASLAAKTQSVEEAFAYCERLARGHYENFPVGSVLIPRSLRPHFYSIYAYSRTADDIADEGSLDADARVALLDDWERQLREAYRGNAEHPIFVALAVTVRERSIPMEPFLDLLKAFRLDARNQGFATTDDLLRYCAHSANPVGRLVLYLFGFQDDTRFSRSDKICTALQLANFWQDISVDLPRGRVNLPRESLERFGYSLQELHAGVYDERFRAMLRHHVEQAEEMFRQGRPLIASVPSVRLRNELRLVYLGGVRILRKIRNLDYNVLASRPELGIGDMLWMATRFLSL